MNRKKDYHLILCILFYILLIFSISACTSTKVQISQRKARCIELNQKGEHAFKKEEYMKALNLYLEALNISRAIEDMDSMGKNLINIAYVYYKMGDTKKAHIFVDQIINGFPSTFGIESLIKAMSIKSLIYYEEKNIEDSSLWIERSLDLCEKNQCNEKGLLLNIKARIILAEKDNKSALEFAKQALEYSRKINDMAETANAFRIIGDIEFLNGDHNASIKAYESAFCIDKELESSEKMVKDLIGIASNYEKQGKIENALLYLRRALSISQGSGKIVMERSVSEKIERLKDKTKIH